jgi:GTP-binding protein
VTERYDVLDARFLAAATRASDLPAPVHPEVAFGGRSNVGKSSLLNTLLSRRGLARTSASPGCTRGLNVFRATLRGEVVVDLVDLPGYGFARVSKTERGAWGPMIEGYLRERPTLRAVAVLVDARRGVEDDDAQLLDYLAHLGRPALLVVTKIDKLPASRRTLAVEQAGRAGGVRAVGFSSETRHGREALWRTMLAACGVADRPADHAGQSGRVAGGPAGELASPPGRPARDLSGDAPGGSSPASGARASAEAARGTRAPGAPSPAGGAAATGKLGTSRT